MKKTAIILCRAVARIGLVMPVLFMSRRSWRKWSRRVRTYDARTVILLTDVSTPAHRTVL